MILKYYIKYEGSIKYFDTYQEAEKFAIANGICTCSITKVNLD